MAAPASQAPSLRAGVAAPARKAPDPGVTRALAALDRELPALIAPLRRWTVPIGILVLALAALYNMHYGAARFGWIDFHSFYWAGQDIRSGIDLYGPALAFVHGQGATGAGITWGTKAYVYAPFFAFVMVPFTLLSPYAALTVWDLLNVGFLTLAVYAALRAAGVRPSAGMTLILAAAAAVIQPIHAEWNLGQTDVLALCLLATSIWSCTAGRRGLAGVLLGIVCAIKPELLLLTVFLLWKREFRFALTAAASGAVLILAPFVVLSHRVWTDFWTVWSFWSGPFVAFIHNEAPKGVLTRLLTANPVVHPLAVAPGLVTVLWVVIVLVVAALVLAVTSPRPLRRDALSLLEVGLVLEAVLLVSPLTEWPYLLMLVIPLVGIVAWLFRADPAQRSTRRAVLAGLAVWLALLGPAEVIEYSLDQGLAGRGLGTALLVLIAPMYLYTLIGAFVLQLRLVARARGLAIPTAVRRAVASLPSLAAAWVRDAGAALPRARRAPAVS
jgi:alpha-1,2-mannosyltransferase